MSVLALTLWQTTTGTTPTATTAQINSGLFYVIAAYAVIWIMIFIYLYSIHRRQAQLKRDIELLREEEQEATRSIRVTDRAESQPIPDSALTGRKQELG